MKYLGKNNTSLSEELELYENCFHTTTIDKENFDKTLFKKSSRLKKIVQKYKDKYPPVRDLICDVYTALYRHYPQLVKPQLMKSSHQLNYRVLEAFTKSSRFKEIRNFSRNDKIASITGTEVFIEDLLKDLDDIITEYNQIMQAMESVIEEASKKLGPGKEHTLDEVKDAMEKAKDKIDQLFKDKVRSKLIRSLNVLAGQQRELGDNIKNWGLGNDGSYQKMPYEEKLGLINKISKNPKLREISLLAGRLKEIYLKGERENSRKAKETLRDVTIGNDLPRVLPSELVGFNHSTYRQVFLKKYSERRLMQHNYGTKSKKGMGPILVLMDSSGSMQGENEIFTKAVALSLLEISRRQKRAFLGIHFSDASHPSELVTHYFSPKKPFKVEQVIEMAEYFESAGTNFEVPLKRSRIEIDKEPEFFKADVIMLTDGCSGVTDAFLKSFLSWRDENNVKVTSILMDRGYGTTKSLEQFSNEVVHLKDISNEKFEAAKTIFKNIF